MGIYKSIRRTCEQRFKMRPALGSPWSFSGLLSPPQLSPSDSSFFPCFPPWCRWQEAVTPALSLGSPHEGYRLVLLVLGLRSWEKSVAGVSQEATLGLSVPHRTMTAEGMSTRVTVAPAPGRWVWGPRPEPEQKRQHGEYTWPASARQCRLDFAIYKGIWPYRCIISSLSITKCDIYIIPNCQKI